MSTVVEKSQSLTFTLTVLGRTLEHLGVMMYKRRDTALAELVANSWDAGATLVQINIPEEGDYDRATGEIIITDNGSGMEPTEIQSQYLVVGRNRRQDGATASSSRPIMGRKGIGKLAGFGIAEQIVVTTWKDGASTEFTLDLAALKRRDDSSEKVEISGTAGDVPAFAADAHGTRITLKHLKHKTPLKLINLREALARRFSRRIRGEMTIQLNGELVGDPSLEIEKRIPEEGYATDSLSDGSEVKYYYAFSKETIKNPELRGFTIYARGRTAQAPPFFFNVESTASGQHATRYITGAIEADFLDEGTDDQSDLISTDRQEIDWDNERVDAFKAWGAALSRRALIECIEFRGSKLRDWILENEQIRLRITRLDEPSKKQVSRFLKILGEAEPEGERALELADSLVRAYEYRFFHDVINDIEAAGTDPNELQQLLSHLHEWKVLESRAVLEIVKGRIDIIDKFHEMVVNDAPETASSKSRDNMHDLLGGYPWILNPEWQVLQEEKTISKTLRDWGESEVSDEDQKLRYDFLALTDERRLVVIEIKRSGHAVTLDDLQRLERYKDRLSKAHDTELYMVMLCSGSLDVSQGVIDSWKRREDGEIRRWSEVFSKTKTYYEHYRAILEGNVTHPDFFRKSVEAVATREALSDSVHRDTDKRKEGLGSQDVDYQLAAVPAPASDVEPKSTIVSDDGSDFEEVSN